MQDYEAKNNTSKSSFKKSQKDMKSIYKNKSLKKSKGRSEIDVGKHLKVSVRQIKSITIKIALK